MLSESIDNQQTSTVFDEFDKFSWNHLDIENLISNLDDDSDSELCPCPMFPLITKPMLFKNCRLSLESRMFQVAMILREKNVSCLFIESLCTWKCCFFNTREHDMFDIHIYQVVVHGEPMYGFEMQSYGGFCSIFSDIYYYLRYVAIGLPIDHTFTNIEYPTIGDAIHNISTALDIKYHNPTRKQMKRIIIETIKSKDPLREIELITESMQLLSKLYDDQDFRFLKSNDIECIETLITVVCNSETCTDWATQYAFCALCKMSYFNDYCKEIFKAIFLKTMFLEKLISRAKKTGSYWTVITRTRCIVLLRNLIRFDDTYIKIVLGVERVNEWLKTVNKE